MVDIASLAIQIDTSDVARAESDLAKLNGAGTKAEKAAKGVEGAFTGAARAAGIYRDAAGRLREANGKLVTEARKVELGLKGIGDQAKKAGAEFNGLSSVAGKVGASIVAALSVREVYQATEAYTSISNRLRLVTDSAGAFAAAQAAVFRVAQEGRQPLTETAELYQRIATNQQQLGLTGEGVARVTETISKSLAVSGASAATAAGALTQLGQAFASGTLRGEELNSVLEGAPALAQTLARGLNVTVGELRNLGAEGKLTAERVVGAILSQSDAMDDAFGKLAPNISGALTTVGNSFTQLVGKMDETSGASSDTARAIMDVAEILSDPATVEAAQIMGTGVAKGIGFIAEAATTTVGVVKWMAEELAATFNGIASDDRVRLEDELARLQEMRESGPAGRLVFFGRDGIVSYKSDAEIDAEIAKIQQALKAYDELGAAAGRTGDASASSAPKIEAFRTGTASLGTAAAEAAGKTDKQAVAFQSLMDGLFPAEAAQRKYNEQVALLDKYLDGDQLAKAIDRLNHSIAGADATGPADAIEEYRKELERLEDKINPAGKAAKDFAAEQAKLRAEIQRTGDPTGKWTRLLEENERQMRLNTEGVSVWAQMTEGAVDRVDSAFADMWKNVFDGTGNVLDGMKNAIKQWMAEVVHMLTTKALMTSVGNWLMGTNNAGGIGQVWGSLLGGGSSSGGGYGIQDGLSTVSAARNAYSLYSVGLAGMANTWGGYLAGAGNMLGMSSLGNFGIGMQGATLAPGLAGPTTIGAGGSMGAGAQVGSGLSSMGGLMANPATWIAAGMLASAKFYDAGYRLDTEDVARQKANKMSFAIDPALSSVLNLGVKTTELATKLLGGGKLANILTGGSLIAGVTGAVDKALFGGAWKTKDYGVGLSVADGEFGARQFEYRKKKGGLFSSSKKKTIWRDLDPETAAALQETFDATEAGVSDLLARIGVSVTDGAYDGLEIARRQISTKGKTEEEISAAISEWFSFAAGRMIAEIDQGIGGFGYSLEELTQRINVFEGVNDSLELINVAVLDLSAHSMELANGMAEAAGGMDAFSAGISAYYGSFFTAAEQQEKVFASLVETFAEAEQVLAASRQDYRDMVEAIDVTTEAGRNLFNTLMGLATQADAYYDILESRAAEAINAAGAAFSGLQAAINAEVGQLQTQYQAAQASVNGLLQLSNSLQSALRSMRMDSDAFDQARRKQAQAQLTGALAFGRAGGDLTTLDLSGSLSELGRDSTQFYGTFEEYARDYWRTANDINSLDKLTGDQLSVEEKTLEAIEGQFAYFDQMLLDAQNQLNALMGIDTSVMSVAAALANFKVAVGAAETAKNAAAPKTAKQTIADTYQSVFGRDAGSGEVNYWLQRIGEGTATTGNLADLFKTSDEYKSKVPGFASGGFHAGGLRLVGENGPELEVTGPSRIYNASQTAAMLGGGGDAAAEVRGLRADFGGMMSALRSVAKHTMQTAKRVEFLERWDFDGLPKERATA